MDFWIEYIDERYGYVMVGLIHSRGHRCGYVGVPKSHALYGIHYSERLKLPRSFTKAMQRQPVGKRSILSLLLASKGEPSPSIIFDVHQSLTYSGQNDYPIKGTVPYWWFGFDCNHAGDKPDFDTAKLYFRYGKEREELEFMLNRGFYSEMDGVIRDKHYVIDECRSLADQLKYFDETIGNRFSIIREANGQKTYYRRR